MDGSLFIPHKVLHYHRALLLYRLYCLVMATFRAKRLDIGGFISAKIIRDHTKRKVFEQYEPQRYAFNLRSALHITFHKSEDR